MNCPKCGKKLQHINVANTSVSTELWLKDEVYIPKHTIFDMQEFTCPECDEYLDDVPISENLQYWCVSGMHKPVLIDLQNVPFDVKSVEFLEKLPKTIKIKKQGKRKKKQKE